MICDDFKEICELYALDVLEREERVRFGDHLRAGCETCTRTLQRGLAINALVIGAVEPVEPSKRLRARVLASLTGRVESRVWWNWAWAAVAASAVLIATWVGLDSRRQSTQLATELSQARQQIERRVTDQRQLAGTLAVLGDPATRTAAPAQGKASYYLNPAQGVVLVAANLQPLDPGRTYQMWIIPKGQAPRPAGLFRPDASGNAVHLFPGTLDLRSTAALAISNEPETGSTAPTTTPALVAPVTGP